MRSRRTIFLAPLYEFHKYSTALCTDTSYQIAPKLDSTYRNILMIVTANHCVFMDTLCTEFYPQQTKKCIKYRKNFIHGLTSRMVSNAPIFTNFHYSTANSTKVRQTFQSLTLGHKQTNRCGLHTRCCLLRFLSEYYSSLHTHNGVKIIQKC